MPKAIIDPELGKLEFTDIEGMMSYDCKMTLPISRKQVEFFFETNSVDNHPTTAQKQFLQNVISDFNKILETIASETGKKQQELEEQYDLDTLGIPSKIELRPKWDLSLLHRQNKSISLLANFEGMNPIKVWFEQEPKKPFILKLFFKIVGLR